MSDKINIKELAKAKIDLLNIESNFEIDNFYGGPSGFTTSMLGQEFPYVIMNGSNITKNQLKFLEIDCMGFIPKLRFTMILSRGKTEYMRYYFPRAGDIVSLFIRSPNDNIKPIRNDYQVVTVDYLGGEGISDSGDSVITVTARLFVPQMYFHQSFSIDGTSFETLRKIATELKLGFASNVDSTDDSMRWMHVGNYEQFMNRISQHAWKDEKSFFVSFIDFYYNLNFINVNQQILSSPKGQPGVISDINIRDPKENTTLQVNLETFKLTNDYRLMSFNNFIAKYDLINNASILTYKEGVVKDYTFYDYTTEEQVTDRVVSLRTDGIGASMTSISDNLSTADQNVREWLGLQYSAPLGNVHKNYSFSEMHNRFNNVELEKMTLNARLLTPNFFVHRGQRLFVEILSYADKFDTVLTSEPIIKLDQRVFAALNVFLSDFYFVRGHKITYDPSLQSGFTQEIYLAKRDWINSPKRQ